jgi:hypothetical protein
MPDSIATYIRAKDGNRPHLMEAAFVDDATLEMVVKVEGMAFPPSAKGIDELTQVLVSRFNQTYENIYTFCLASPLGTHHGRFPATGSSGCPRRVRARSESVAEPTSGRSGRPTWS